MQKQFMAQIPTLMKFQGKSREEVTQSLKDSLLLAPSVSAFLHSGFSRETAYPAITPYKTHFLQVSDVHTLYVEESGNANGFPVIVFHGGPGGASSPFWRTLFDPEFWRIIMFDQPGCGQSRYTEGGQLVGNLIMDQLGYIEKIRKHLKIEKWAVYGGSWGTTLGLTYGIVHKKRVVAEMGRGMFTARPSEIEWMYGSSGAANIWPEKWKDFVSAPGMEPGKNAAYYVPRYRALMDDPDEAVRLDAARRWEQWEDFVFAFRLDLASVRSGGEAQSCFDEANLENWYFYNNCGFPKNEDGTDCDNWILKNIEALKRIPCAFASARYDCDCPRTTAWDIKTAYPDLELVDVFNGNHAGFDPPVVAATVGITNYFAYIFSGGLMGVNKA